MNYYGISGERNLAHHGIKGMKWGIRRFQNPDGSLTSAGKRRYANREQYINKYERENKGYRESIAKSKHELDDLNKNGVNSETFKKAFGDPNTDYGESFKDRWGFSSRKEALASMKKRTKRDIDNYHDWLETNDNRISNIKNTPIHEKSYAELWRDGERAAKAVFAAGAIQSVAVSALASSKGLISGKLAVKTALVGIGFSAYKSFNVAAKGADRANKHLDQYIEKRDNSL